ncbi:MAG: hypothetical protein ACRDNS_04745, partial [Trebonia sp.]
CDRRAEAGRKCGCCCLRGYAIAGTRHGGCQWADRYGYLSGDHLVGDPEDEPRLAADVSLRDAGLWPDAVITPDGDVRHLGGGPGPPSARRLRRPAGLAPPGTAHEPLPFWHAESRTA